MATLGTRLKNFVAMLRRVVSVADLNFMNVRTESALMSCWG
jgi:hypothetical protein